MEESNKNGGKAIPERLRLSRIWRNFITGGLPRELLKNRAHSVVFFNVFVLITLTTVTIFSFYNLYLGRYTDTAIELFFSAWALGALIMLRLSHNFPLSKFFGLVGTVAFMTILFWRGGLSTPGRGDFTGFLWWFCLPAAAFYLEGSRLGWWWVGYSILNLVAATVMAMAGVGGVPYSPLLLRLFTVCYVIVSLLVYSYERVIERREAEILMANERLQEEVEEKERAQQAQEISRAEAEEANRAKSDFLSRMSHELRTPLNSIIGFSQILLTETQNPLDPSQSRSVEEILTGGRHLLTLINEVLDLSRIEQGRITMNLEPADPGVQLIETLTAMRPLAEARGISFQDQTAGFVLPKIMADPHLLKQILLNLLSNAVKYNRHNGFVRVEASLPKEGFLRLSVTDSGHGIPPEKQALIFEPFQRLGEEAGEVEGTGIGLTISKKLTEMMSGTIGFTSSPGLGSCFFFDLPLAEGSAVTELAPRKTVPKQAPQKQAPEPPAEKVAVGGVILHIEDDAANRTLVRHILGRKPGLRLIETASGREGLDLANHHRPDLILLDMHLPDMHGSDVFSELYSHPETHGIPVIVVSASAMPHDVERIRKAGVAAYLTKPLEVKLLLETVDTFLKRKT